MAVDLENRPEASKDSDSETQSSQNATPGFNGATPQGLYDDEFDKIVAAQLGHGSNDHDTESDNPTPEPSDLANAENSPTQPKTAEGVRNENDNIHKKLAGAPKTPEAENEIPFHSEDPGRLQTRVLKRLGTMAKGKRSKLALGIIGFLFAGSGIMLSTTGPALGLVHIKEVLTQEVGGVSSKVVRFRSGKLYSRAFFFDDSGKFAGYKERGGALSYFKNDNTDKLTAALQKDGFKVDYDTKTGKFLSIFGNDNGPTIKNANEFESRFFSVSGKNVRKDISAALEKSYPEKGLIWRSVQSRQLTRRMGFSRGLDLYNTKAVNYLKGVETGLRAKLKIGEKMKAYVRGKLTGAIAGDDIVGDATPKVLALPGEDPLADPKNDPKKIAAEREKVLENGNKAVRKDVAQAAKDTLEKVAKNPLADIEQQTEDVLKKVAIGSVARSVKNVPQEILAGDVVAANTLCQTRSLVSAGIAAAPVYRYRSLLSYSAAILPILDSIKAGHVKSEDVAAVSAILINTKDKDGKTIWASSAWRNMTSHGGVAVSADEYRKAAVSTKLLGISQDIKNSVYNKKIAGTACKAITNPFINIAASAFSVARKGIGGVFSLGTISAVDIATGVAASLGAQALYETAKFVFVPMIATALAGLTCNAGETGVLVGACLVASYKALSMTRVSKMGMHPLTNKQSAYYDDILHQDKLDTYASMSVWNRYFSFSNPYSLASTAVVQTPVGLGGFAHSGMSFIRSIPNLFSGNFLFSSMSGSVNHSLQKAHAAENPDSLAVDELGFPVMGVSPTANDNPKYELENTVNYLMDQNSFLNLDGTPNLTGETDINGTKLSKDSQKIIKNIAGKIEDYRKQCIDTDTDVPGESSNFGNVLIDKDGNQSETCSDVGLDTVMEGSNGEAPLRMYQMYRLDNGIGKSIADTVNGTNDASSEDTNGDGVADDTSDGGNPVDGTVVDSGPASGSIVSVSGCAQIKVDSSIADNISKMIAAAKADGVTLCSGQNGGYRSSAQQIALRIAHCGSSAYAIHEAPASSCKPPTAKPGRSMHEKGLAIDFSDKIRQCPAKDGARCTAPGVPEWEWLFKNASKYGMQQLRSEAWHWSTNGN